MFPYVLLLGLLPALIVVIASVVAVAVVLIPRIRGRPRVQIALTFLVFGPLVSTLLLTLALLALTFLSPSALADLRADGDPVLTVGLNAGLVLGLALLFGYWLGALPALIAGVFAALISRRIGGDWQWVGLVTAFGALIGLLIVLPGAQYAPPALFAALAGASAVSAAACAALSLKRRPRAVA